MERGLPGSKEDERICARDSALADEVYRNLKTMPGAVVSGRGGVG